MKKCNRCQQIKNRSEDFYPRHSDLEKNKDRRVSICKQCANEIRWEKRRNEEQLSAARTSNRASYNKHKSRYQRQTSARMLYRKIKCLEYLGQMSCMYCDTDHPAMLHFHHRNPSEKLFCIGTALANRGRYTPEELFAELDKCDVICANCHEVLHSRFTEVWDEYVHYRQKQEPQWAPGEIEEWAVSSNVVIEDFRRSKTHCKYGHPLSGDNLYRIKTGANIGKRSCQICNRRRREERTAKDQARRK